MTENSIVNEVHRIREEMLAEYDGDLRRLIADARRKTEEAIRAGEKTLLPNHDAGSKKSDARKAG